MHPPAHPLRFLKPGFTYFLIVFGAGFALAFIRLPFLVPRFGVRAAELMEMPVMLAVIAWASWRLAKRHADLGRGSRLLAGRACRAAAVSPQDCQAAVPNHLLANGYP